MNESVKYIAKEAVLNEDLLEDEILLYDLEKGIFGILDEVGYFLYSNLSEAKNIDEIIDMMSEEYDDIPETIKDDLNLFLEDLIEKGFLIKINDGA